MWNVHIIHGNWKMLHENFKSGYFSKRQKQCYLNGMSVRPSLQKLFNLSELRCHAYFHIHNTLRPVTLLANKILHVIHILFNNQYYVASLKKAFEVFMNYFSNYQSYMLVSHSQYFSFNNQSLNCHVIN